MTVNVFVAATPSEWLPMKVLEHSIRETTVLPVEVAAIASFQRQIPLPRELKNQPRTPFSFQRFLIPELCGFQGRAIYLDADMQVFTDIADLWNAPMGDHDLLTVREGTSGRRGQFSVVLLDCARLHWRIEQIVHGLDNGRYSYEQLMHEMCVAGSVGRVLDPEWNSLERFQQGRTRLLHYTDMDTQPWVSLHNPLESMWVECLRRAVQARVVTIDDLEREVAASHVRPSLLPQVQREAMSRAQLRQMDRQFVAPYKSIRTGKSSPFVSWRSRMATVARRGLRGLRQLVDR
jgi:hypothetical protein